MDNNGSPLDITLDFITDFDSKRGKHKDTNDRIEGQGGMLDMLIVGELKMSEKSLFKYLNKEA